MRPVVSCKGTTCQYGLIDTFDLSEKLHELYYIGYHGVSLPHKFKIAVGGCPNNCVKPNLNDLGIIGQRLPEIDLDKCKGCKVCQVENRLPDQGWRSWWTEKSGFLRTHAITAGAVSVNVHLAR